uniref:Immunoglobulin V-set domain-containing protein n=2 Tax=Pygocentrus nattereri TaxID=42514 RepID=A0AAR2KGM0_PYGNA
MGVNSTFSSLTITAVTLSDSGLYYCSTLREKYMIFSTTTHLQIRDDCRSEFFMLVLLSALLFLLFIMLKYREQLREDSNSKVKEEKEDGEMMNYAALHFKKNRRSHRRAEAEDLHVVFSSVGQ